MVPVNGSSCFSFYLTLPGKVDIVHEMSLLLKSGEQPEISSLPPHPPKKVIAVKSGTVKNVVISEVLHRW